MSSIQEAVILAAGEGKRLHSLLPDRPKGFLEFGGTSLIQRSIDLLQAAGIKKIWIMAGFHANFYVDLTQGTPAIEVVENPDFSTSGSLYSFYLLKDRLTVPFLLLESDLLYEWRALEALLAHPQENTILISGFTHSGDEVFVSGEKGRIDGISKDQTGLKNVCGELVGISKLTPDYCRHLFTYAEGLFSQAGLNFHYEEGISAISPKIRTNYCKVDDLIWTEIDDESHYKRAFELIWPRLV